MNQEKDLSQKSRIKRKLAKKILINDILNSTYIKRPGWDPSGILTKYGEITRVQIMGIIVSTSNDNNTLLVDDGSGNITIRLFENSAVLNDFALGDLVIVVGKPREFSSNKYVVPEIIKRINDKKWFKVHQLHIKLQNKSTVELPISQEQPHEPIETGPYQKILNIIAILDKGDGADVQDIVKNTNAENSEQIVSNLIEEGEVFEISPGKVKLLE
jgi:RPA family protein